MEEVNHAITANDVIEKRFDDTCSRIRKNDEKLKAPELENIHGSIPVTADEKKHNIEEITVNRKEMVLEVLMAENPNVPAKYDLSTGDDEGGNGDDEGGNSDDAGGEGKTGDSEGDNSGDASNNDSGAGEKFGGNGGNESGRDNSDVEWTESDDDESLSEADLGESLPEFEKDRTDEKIEYETVDGQKVETDFSLDRSKWFKPHHPIHDPLIQKIKPKKTENTSKIISWMYDSVKDMFIVKRRSGDIQCFRYIHALQSLPRWDIRTLSKLDIINPHNIGVANFAESLILRE
ncbi:hypothetical protein L1987_46687 [Smallanthus sonchifolius]|uniref:Uncharacterized protein n=1 Tax=Smallanthus sonchifolius TaxID=185202 RepID=A0ACB9G0A8_9ASTR|nr:hypothetical protein L1987_46687 [Smallanthus sonchifolius]